MSIEATIKSTLDAYSNLTALTGTRIYSERLPQQPTYPNIFFSRTLTEPSNTLGARNNLTKVVIQFEVRATTLASKRNVITQLKAALAASTITNLWLDEQTIPYEDDVKVYRSDLDYSIWFIDT